MQLLRFFFLNLKMRKLREDSTYDYSDSGIKTLPLHINPQAENVTDDIMNRAIHDIAEKFDNASAEGSGWSLQFLNEIVVHIVASHKLGVPVKFGSVGTWSKIPAGIRGHFQLKNLYPGSAQNYNCLEACI